MDLSRIPPVAYTDDGVNIRLLAPYDFDRIGLKVALFETNDALLQEVNQGSSYAAAILDYDTKSIFTGAQTLVALHAMSLQNPDVVGEIVAISSSTTEQFIINGLQEAAQTQGFQVDTIPVHIFDKVIERQMAILFVSLKAIFSELRDMNKLTLYKALGINPDDIWDIEDKVNAILTEINKDKSRLVSIKDEAMRLIQEDQEAKLPRNARR